MSRLLQQERGRRQRMIRSARGLYAFALAAMLFAMSIRMRPALALAFALCVQLPATAQTGTAYVPKAIELPGLTPAEATANAIWSLRGAMNVAALQCQFSPFLRIVPRYNSMIRQHAQELERARAALGRYFVRKNGSARGGANAFDHYNTVMFQSYSTLDAQYSFCDRAAIAGRDALVQPVGRLGQIAVGEVAALRTSLTPLIEQFVTPVQVPIAGIALPELGCFDKRGRPKARC